ncbi:LysR family transcriptional regulator [Lactobacillus sp. PSON]|uniref:LysR family transcriptional regulator n=1 Tax=Lactobacillus sp. PSON TaxID=3455454 RepID=UPI004041C88F
MNLKHLEFFITLAKTEHMAKAAELLGISQPSLSYAINNLEDELGAPLFEKDGRNIKLTNYGKIYLAYVQNSLNTLKRGNEYISELLDVNRGHINLGFTYTMGQDLVPRLVHEFKQKNPQEKISFEFKQGTTNQLVNDLLNDKLDLIIASKPEKISINNKINAYHLVDQEMVAAVPINHNLAKYDSVSIRDLIKYPFIMYSSKSGLRPRLNQIFKNANVIPNIKLEAVEDHTIIGFVHWNYGVAIIPNLPQLNPKEVKILHLKNNIGVHPIYIITKANHFLTPSATQFLEFCQTYCRIQFLNKGKMI